MTSCVNEMRGREALPPVAVRFCSGSFIAPRDVSGTALPPIVSPLLFCVGSCSFLRRLSTLAKLFLASPSPLQMLRGWTTMNVNSLCRLSSFDDLTPLNRNAYNGPGLSWSVGNRWRPLAVRGSAAPAGSTYCRI